MKTTKTLMLAAFTALSLGVGSAMAQEGGGPSMPTTDYWAGHRAQTTTNQIQSGSSDVQAPRGAGAIHFDYGTLANPG